MRGFHAFPHPFISLPGCFLHPPCAQGSKLFSVILFFAFLLSLSSCTFKASPSLTYHRDIKPILFTKCAVCHTRGGIAPFSVTEYESLFPYRVEIALRVRDGTMPPWFAAPTSHPLQNDPSLSEEEKGKIVRWVEEGAPEGSPEDNSHLKPTLPRGLSRVDRVITMPVPYTPSLYPVITVAFSSTGPRPPHAMLPEFV